MKDYVMDTFIAKVMKAMNEMADKSVGVPDVTVLSGFAATSTVLCRERIDGGGIGAADWCSATSFASASIPHGPSMKSLGTKPTEGKERWVADVALCVLPARFGGQTPATPSGRKGTGRGRGWKDREAREMDARGAGWAGAEGTREMDAPSGHPLPAAHGSGRSSGHVGFVGLARSITELRRNGTTLAVVTTCVTAPLTLRNGQRADADTVMAMAPAGGEPLRSHFIRRPLRPAPRHAARPLPGREQLRSRTRFALTTAQRGRLTTARKGMSGRSTVVVRRERGGWTVRQ